MDRSIVALIGRPNVGKSTLFNKLVGRRISIVSDTPGVTRDRVYSECEWLNHKFMLVDTGGIEPNTKDVIFSQMKLQSELAIETADTIILVVDVKDGVTSNDYEVASMIQKSGKPVILCVNKIDNIGSLPSDYYEFYNLGLGDPIAVSSLHGHGTGDLLDAVLKNIQEKDFEDYGEEYIKIAIIGKPNTGKSSLINNISGENRVIVSEIAGTTRDSIDSIIENDEGKFIFIDTAGIRKKSKVHENIERYSVLRAYMAVDRADVCLILIDAQEGFTEQDSKIAGYAHEQGKASIIVVNKWDLIEKDTNTMKEYKENLKDKFSFMSYVPYIFISALTGQRVEKLYPLIKSVDEQNKLRISTGILNDTLGTITSRVQPPSDKGKRLKIYYMTQVHVKPPTFALFVNNKDLFHFSYQRYIENQLRLIFGFEGTPIKFVIRERTKK